jgi:hypothetical protein
LKTLACIGLIVSLCLICFSLWFPVSLPKNIDEVDLYSFRGDHMHVVRDPDRCVMCYVYHDNISCVKYDDGCKEGCR